MRRAAVLIALLLAACNLEEALDNSEPEPGKTITIKRCAGDSAQAADTTRFARCEVDPKPQRPE